ncbi:MAG TPA: nucleotidyltransferase family protein [Vicinamibacterales bacterium]|jgi:glucose-1-phosphate thymidylyltransferase
MTERAVILARGLGTRLRAADGAARLTDEQQHAADAGLKALMPINGRPFLDYSLSTIADAGVRDVALVVAPEHEALKRRYTAVAAPSRLRLDFIVQPEALGTADAVLAIQDWAAREPFMVMNADNLYPSAALRELAALEEPGLPAFDADDLVRSSNIPAERIAAFALIRVDADGYLTSIVEKPRDAASERKGARRATAAGPGVFASERPGTSGMQRHGSAADWSEPASRISMNVWRFDARVFDACRDVPKSIRGEFELPEAVGLAASRGVRFRVIPARGPVLDLSRRADAAELERRLRDVRPNP